MPFPAKVTDGGFKELKGLDYIGLNKTDGL